MSDDLKITAVVAMSDNRCIGKDNDLPWHIPEDLKHFKALTVGKPVVMGRKTFESIYKRLGKPLPHRTNIVVSRSGFAAEGVLSFDNMEDALDKARAAAAEQGLDEIIIGGGAQIYQLALPFTTHIHLTEVHMDVDGDAFFPELNEDDWVETANEYHGSDPQKGTPPFSFKTLERIVKK